MRTYADQPSGTINRARELRRNAGEPERRLWRALRETFPDLKWRRQVPIGPYYADLLCFSEKLIVEVDGDTHAATANYDASRTAFLAGGGYRVVRVVNADVLGNLAGVVATITSHLPAARSGKGRPAGAALPSPRAAARLAPLLTGEG